MKSPKQRWIVTALTAMLCTILVAIASPFLQEPAQSQMSQSDVEMVLNMEQRLEREFETYFDQDLADVTQTPTDIARTLNQLGNATDTTPAVMWVTPRPDHLRLVLITPTGETVVRDLFDVPIQTLNRAVRQFRQEVSNPNRRSPMTAGKQLHEWIIEPFEADFFEPGEIDTLLFCLGPGVRGIPLSALYDGDQFLVERYNLSHIPAFNLIQTDYQPWNQRRILAMGASEFSDKDPLPAVPTELSTIQWALAAGRMMGDQWDSQTLLNQDFTLPALLQMVANESFDVVHLATHAEFRPGAPQQSYIQFWDARLGLDQTDRVGWDNPPLELLVLSACRTALGDDTAELGFAGLALKAGVKSAIASLWTVSDFGTLALMSDFYQQLGETTTKAEALRQAQIDLLKGNVRVDGTQLRLSGRSIDLPNELVNTGIDDFSHPFYWAGFTMISSPW